MFEKNRGMKSVRPPHEKFLENIFNLMKDGFPNLICFDTYLQNILEFVRLMKQEKNICSLFIENVPVCPALSHYTELLCKRHNMCVLQEHVTGFEQNVSRETAMLS